MKTTITTTHNAGFRRGDFIETSGFVNEHNNNVFVIRRAGNTQYLIEPAGFWDRVMYQAGKIWNALQWHFWGMANKVEDTWNRLRRK